MDKRVEAIDPGPEHVRTCEYVTTRAEVDRLRVLADEVYFLAYPHGLADALPRAPELLPGLGRGELTPVQLESKVHLPGDWGTPSGRPTT